MEFLTENLSSILLVITAIYPPLIFLLPAKYATRLDLGIKVFKKISDTLESAKQTKGGLTNKKEDINIDSTQKHKV